RSPSPTPRSRIDRAPGLSFPARAVMNAEISADFQERPIAYPSGDRQHPVQGEPGLPGDRFGNDHLVHEKSARARRDASTSLGLSFDQPLENVEKMLWI